MRIGRNGWARGWARRALTVALVGLVAGCAAAAVPRAATGSAPPEQVGLTQYSASSRQLAPALSGLTLSGSHFALDSVRGEVVVVNVWASWCGPCRAESPDLARAAAQLAGQPVRFIGIDETDNSAQAAAFVAATGANYPNLVDGHGSLLGQLHVLPQAAIPSTVILDRRGRIADRVIGAVTQAEVQKLVAVLLQES